MKPHLYYYGTSLDSHGHYFHDVYQNSILRTYTIDFKNVPFNPESLRFLPFGSKNGDTQYSQYIGWSIFAIEGSCTDKRPKSRSIFFIAGNMDEQQLKDYILSFPIVVKMINQMSFEVNGIDKQYIL